MIYSFYMKTIRWNPDKAALLKETRAIDLDRVAIMIEEKEVLGIYEIPSRPGQKMFVLDYEDYLVCIPFVEDEHEIFIKTAYRSRKHNKAKKDT